MTRGGATPNAIYAFQGDEQNPLALVQINPGGWQCFAQDKASGAYQTDSAQLQRFAAKLYSSPERSDRAGDNNGFDMKFCDGNQRIAAGFSPLNRKPDDGWRLQVLSVGGC